MLGSKSEKRLADEVERRRGAKEVVGGGGMKGSNWGRSSRTRCSK